MTQSTINSRYVSVKDVAGHLGVSKMTIYRMLHSGEIPSVRVGRSFRIDRVKLKEWIDRHAS